MSPNAKTYFDLWLRLDALRKAGLGESSSADDLRDEMDEPWYRLSKAEIDEVGAAFAANEQAEPPNKES